jgi:Ca2+-binding RTX toxin-like protein
VKSGIVTSLTISLPWKRGTEIAVSATPSIAISLNAVPHCDLTRTYPTRGNRRMGWWLVFKVARKGTSPGVPCVQVVQRTGGSLNSNRLTKPRVVALAGAALIIMVVAQVAAPQASRSTLSCMGKHVTITGGKSGGLTVGTRHDDVIKTHRGDDLVRARGGDDRVCTGRGNDTIRLGAGKDAAKASVGNDSVIGGKGADLLRGEKAADVLHGGAGPDHLKGGPGNDKEVGGPGNDWCKGGVGSDENVSCEHVIGIN